MCLALGLAHRAGEGPAAVVMNGDTWRGQCTPAWVAQGERNSLGTCGSAFSWDLSALELEGSARRLPLCGAVGRLAQGLPLCSPRAPPRFCWDEWMDTRGCALPWCSVQTPSPSDVCCVLKQHLPCVLASVCHPWALVTDLKSQM